MSWQIVVAFRMSPEGTAPGPEGSYLSRARSLYARGEALGGRLVAWSSALLAVAWDPDSLEEAILLATSLREEALAIERAWAGGIAEGEIEALAPEGPRSTLAWGEALVTAVMLARVAKPGEVVVDGNLSALRAAQLSVTGKATDGAGRVRGWRLDLEHPWQAALHDEEGPPADATDRYVVFPATPAVSPTPQAAAGSGLGGMSGVTEGRGRTPALERVERSEGVEGRGGMERPDGQGQSGPTEGGLAPASAAPSGGEARGTTASGRAATGLADKVRQLAKGHADAIGVREAVAELRLERAHLDGAPAAVRCQASLALALALCVDGGTEEALLEALDALGRARETNDPRALAACLALLAKLYSHAGRHEGASQLAKRPG